MTRAHIPTSNCIKVKHMMLYAAASAHSPVVISREVVEHIDDPRTYPKRLLDWSNPAGWRPYQHYNLKKSGDALCNKFRRAPRVPGGITGTSNYGSMVPLNRLLEEAGVAAFTFRCVRRLPPLVQSIITIAKRSK